MNVDLTIPQAEFFQSTAKSTAAVAGFGSGKTQTSVTRLIATAMEHPKADFLFIAPTVVLIRDVLYPKLREMLPEIGMDFSINKSENIVYLHGLGKIYCRSGEHPERIVGMEVLDAFLDELDVMTEEKALEVWRKAKARCRQKVENMYTGLRKTNQMWVSTTPEGYKATYELFKKNPLPNSHLVQMSTYSNAHNLPDDYIEDLRANYPEQLIAAYLRGEFTNLTNASVWNSFNVEGNNVIGAKIKKGDTLHTGIDFNVGRGCAVTYKLLDLPVGHPGNPLKNDIWPVMLALSEVVDSFDTPDSIRTLREQFPQSDFPDHRIYPDSTGASRKTVNASISDIWLLKKSGFTIRKRGKNPAIKDRVISTNAAFCNSLGQRRLYIDVEKCPNLVESVTKQVYNKNGLPEKGFGKFDDMTDSFSYPVYYHFPVKKPAIGKATVGGT